MLDHQNLKVYYAPFISIPKCKPIIIFSFYSILFLFWTLKPLISFIAKKLMWSLSPWLMVMVYGWGLHSLVPLNNYTLKVRYGNTIKRCEICSKLTTKTLERRQWRRSGVFIVNFEHISHLFLVFLLNRQRFRNQCC